jgi:hypothetical protein
MKVNIINECDGGFTQPSAISGIRQDIFKRKVEEASIDRNSKDAGIQFRDLVEKTQDELNDYIDISGWDNIPQKNKVIIKKFQGEFDNIMNSYSTPPRDLPLYKLWDLLSEKEQTKLLYEIEEINKLLDRGYVVKKEIKRV